MRICLITPGQPSINPRLVKEADTLHEAGHDVHVLCSHYIPWADEADKLLLASRAWSCTYVGGNPGRVSPGHYWTRVRHAVARRALPLWPSNTFVQRRALVRIVPELEAAALNTRADLYIAHYAGALPAAAMAARQCDACLGFDAEDLESASYSPQQGPSHLDLLLQKIEARYLPECNYVTASSPGIAEAYAAQYGLPLPSTILNVFPLANRPAKFRPTSQKAPLTLYWFSQTVGLDRGLHDVIRALGMLRGCSIELHIRGALHEKTRQELFAAASSCGVENRQLILMRPGAQDEMVRLASEYDVGLALEPGSSRNNDLAISNKLFTYLLAGNAVVATATHGQRAVIARIGEAGFCCDPGDAQVLANRLRLWYEDRAALDGARWQAWCWGTREYNWDVEKEKFLSTVEGVLSCNRGGPSHNGREAACCSVQP